MYNNNYTCDHLCRYFFYYFFNLKINVIVKYVYIIADSAGDFLNNRL